MIFLNPPYSWINENGIKWECLQMSEVWSAAIGCFSGHPKRTPRRWTVLGWHHSKRIGGLHDDNTSWTFSTYKECYRKAYCISLVCSTNQHVWFMIIPSVARPDSGRCAIWLWSLDSFEGFRILSPWRYRIICIGSYDWKIAVAQNSYLISCEKAFRNSAFGCLATANRLKRHWAVRV